MHMIMLTTLLISLVFNTWTLVNVIRLKRLVIKPAIAVKQTVSTTNLLDRSMVELQTKRFSRR